MEKRVCVSEFPGLRLKVLSLSCKVCESASEVLPCSRDIRVHVMTLRELHSVTNLPNSWVLGRSGRDLASRYMSPSGLTSEVFDEGSDLP